MKGQKRRKFITNLGKGIIGTTFLGNLALGNYACTSKNDGNTDQTPEDSAQIGQKNNSGNKKLGVALVGLGSYSAGQLAPALQQTKFCELRGIVTGTPAKAKEWSGKYNIPEKNIYNYENFDTIRDNEDIDIIYVVLPNSMHAEYVIRAAQASKHVICEKPMAITVKECQDMIDACKKAGKKLSVGYRLHFEPFTQEIMRLGQKKIHGPIERLETAFGFEIGDPTQWRLKKKMAGGGPLMDVGIYAIQGSIYTLGELPISVTASQLIGTGPKFKEVEESISWEFEFPSGIKCISKSSYSEYYEYLKAFTKDTEFGLSPAYSYGGLKGYVNKEKLDFPAINQQAAHMDAFTRCILDDTDTTVPGEMGMRDVALLQAIYQAAETGKKIKLDLSSKIIDKV
ncbi:MAG: Gfo/Idh/MocA family oxidoreductase [Microscillaceae bacterium]|nr:Gfo/Idh/MocA family oxidoreductase [Microscillaceae bacterium]